MKMEVADFRIETTYFDRGFRSIAGVDEVGRGALFGPVVAAAVVFPERFYLRPLPPWAKEIDDSKRLSPTKRKKMMKHIIEEAVSVGIGMATNFEIDRKNIFWASHLAMRRAVEHMSLKPDVLLVDGFPLKDVEYFQIGIRQGDKKSASIAAASIVAKVLRDELMCFFETLYQGYGLAKNKGYGTRDHYRAIQERGPACLHRRTFNLGPRS